MWLAGYTWDMTTRSKNNLNKLQNQGQTPPVTPGKSRKYNLRSYLQRANTPAVVFLIITIILSATVFYLSMKSGVPEFSLPDLAELTSTNVASLKEIHQIEKWVSITAMSFSPDGNYLADTRADNILHVWSTQDYQLIYTFQTESFCESCIAFSPDSRFLATVRDERPYDVIVWNLETGKSIWESMGTLVNSTEKINSLTFSPDGKLLVGAIANRILFWKADTLGFELIREIVGHSGLIRSLAFSPDGRHLLTTSNDKTAKVWDVETGDWLITLSGHTDFVARGVFSPAGDWIVTAGYDNTIRIWDSQTGLILTTLSDQAGPVISLAFSPNGQLLASGAKNQQIVIWNGLALNPIITLKKNLGEVIPLAFSPDNKLFVTTNMKGALRLWGVEK
jgi:WD40 repeat protein